MAQEVLGLDDALGCEIVNRMGRVLVRANKQLNLSIEWEEVDGILRAVIWGAVTRVESAFGKAETMVVDFENMRIIGFPLGLEGPGLVVATSKTCDPYALRARILKLVGT